MHSILIVGAGPAGLFCADEILNHTPKAEITIMDMGSPMKGRWCPKTQACNCRSCYVLEGEGGAGGFSDGKLPYSLLRGTQLEEVFDPSLEPRLRDIDAKVVQHAGEGVWYDPVIKAPDWWESKDLEFTSYPLRHVGSDGIQAFSIGMVKELQDRGVTFRWDTTVLGVEPPHVSIADESGYLSWDTIILSPGIQGLPWIAERMKSLGIPLMIGPSGIGMRVETDIEDMSCLFGEFYDWKVLGKSSTGIPMRSFCCNSGGFVVNQWHRTMGIRAVNGHSPLDPGQRSHSANFALIAKIEPGTYEDPQAFVYNQAKAINQLSDGHTVVQNLYEFLSGAEPTGFDPPYKTNYMARPARIAEALEDDLMSAFSGFLDSLMDAVPSIDPSRALVYMPEIKYPAGRVPVDLGSFRVPGYDNLYVIGDATGYVDSFVAAALTGIVAAHDLVGRES